MGFTRGVAITVDADFEKNAVEPEMSDFYSEIAGSDFSDKHIDANDKIMDLLLVGGKDPSVVDTANFKRAAVYHTLAFIWLGMAQRVGDLGILKHEKYLELFEKEFENQIALIDSTATINDLGGLGLPVATNRDSKDRFQDEDIWTT